MLLTVRVFIELIIVDSHDLESFVNIQVRVFINVVRTMVGRNYYIVYVRLSSLISQHFEVIFNTIIGHGDKFLVMFPGGTGRGLSIGGGTIMGS